MKTMRDWGHKESAERLDGQNFDRLVWDPRSSDPQARIPYIKLRVSQRGNSQKVNGGASVKEERDQGFGSKNWEWQ